MDEQQVKQNVDLFREMINCNAEIYMWCCDANGHVLESNCPNEAIFSTVFQAFGCGKTLYDHGHSHDEPLAIGTPLGLSWFAAFRKEDGEIRQVYLMGPVFTTEVSFRGIEQALEHCPELNISIAWKIELIRVLEKVPVVSSIILNQYVMMLNYCVTGKKVTVADIRQQVEKPLLPDGRQIGKDRHKTWIAEQALLQTVREGDLNYRDALKNSSNLSDGVPVHVNDSLRKAKDSCIVFTSLCTRAAIEGGLSPEQAYSLGDVYIQSVEECRSVEEVGGINYTMLDDFVHRVHKCRVNPNVSKQIRQCCDYIETHTEEKLTISMLAAKVGYTEYYLSRKFKAEMNVALNDYIKIARIERAKFLLETTEDSIQDLATRLNFCSRSHFGETFRKVVGCSPVEYRERR